MKEINEIQIIYGVVDSPKSINLEFLAFSTVAFIQIPSIQIQNECMSAKKW
ncbi:hypothetical protein KFK09_018913 [Dendrobium nobile]|uniref:Uncharacterized protein n=1 Tax=Dendrobium nobile TaxID=94219 RepID=A0A8T3AX42_DENNO|nr:hypothetical protein KFK09_018913 [Dendrobium nobile]